MQYTPYLYVMCVLYVIHARLSLIYEHPHCCSSQLTDCLGLVLATHHLVAVCFLWGVKAVSQEPRASVVQQI